MKKILLPLLILSSFAHAQVDTSFVFNTSTPYGTLDIRIAKSSTRYYYLQENITVSFRESAPGVKTNTYRDMTSWDSSPFSQGNLRERNGTSDNFIMNYRLLFPTNYQPGYANGYPMIVMMHGAGERANCWDEECYWGGRSWRPQPNDPPAPTASTHRLLNNDHNLSHGGRQHLEARNRAEGRLPDDPLLAPRAFSGFILFAQNLNGWDTGSTQDLIKLVRLAAKKYNVDPNRIYIHGLSNGGIATYNVIKRAPWLFAAALPMSAPTEAGIISQGLLPEVAHIPLWTFQGGRDIEPTPARTESYIRAFRNAGADVRYSLYPSLGHGTWNTAYGEPEFFSWMRSKSKTNIHVFFGNSSLCGSSEKGVKLGLANGFLAYQWQRDGAVIAGAKGHEYIATQPGVYRARFSRESSSPASNEWEEWSPPITVTASSSGPAQIIPLTTTHLRGPDNAATNTIRLKSGVTADRYNWYKNGVLIDIPNNDMDDTVSIYTITSTSATDNGAYTLRTAALDGCESPPSETFNLFFNNSAPLLSSSNVPGSFSLVSVTGSSATLRWEDRSSIETAYEIWRRAPGQTFQMVGRTTANVQTFTDRGLIPSTTYAYKIRALNNEGRSGYAPADDVESNLVVTTQGDAQAPSVPSNLRVIRNTTSSISLAWDAATDDNGINQYVVNYGSQSVNTNSSGTTFTLTGLPINASYNITVKAMDNAGLVSPASNAVTGTTSVTGLWYGHSTGAWTDLDLITNWNEPEFTGWVPNITLAPRTQEDFFNFEFTGYLYIKQAGDYNFYLNSDDGSRLYINGSQVVDFDGTHGRSGANDGFGVASASPLSLTAGPHEIRVIFFEYTGGQSLSVAYQGADTKNVIINIPDAALTSGKPSSSTNTHPVVSITSPEPDQQFTGPANINITATASDSDGTVTKVEFYNGTQKLGEDLSSPYAFLWADVPPGSYTVSAKAIDDKGASTSATIKLSVVSGSACAGAGSIQAEIWSGISGTNISSIPLDTPPSSVIDLNIFETPSNRGDNYGSRIRGYLCVPVSGSYMFWLATDDTGELWLSTDESPANKVKIAFVSGWTRPREWEKYTSQKSAAINLVAGRRYYVEALMKEAAGGDNLAVGWQLPDGTLERPIAGNRLSPYGESQNGLPLVDITNPADGSSFTAPATINIAATASDNDGTVSKVEFYNGVERLGEDLTSPYTFTWENVSWGSYTITAKAIDNSGGSSEASIDITVSSGSGCAGTGQMQMEVWTGIPGRDISSIPLDSPPNSVMDIYNFETISNIGDDYGSRVRGYLCVPSTGAYTFWIASDDNGELWLSTNEDPGNKTKIAYVAGWTYPRQWEKYTTQRSAPINLIAGQRYYVEALLKEGAGGDNLAIGWQLPGGTLERPIPGLRLSPYEVQATMTSYSARSTGMESDLVMEESTDAYSEDQTLAIFPNPATTGLKELTISGYDETAGPRDTKVEVLRMTGELVFSERVRCESGCREFSLALTKDLAPGVYVVNVISNDKRDTRRLVVR